MEIDDVSKREGRPRHTTKFVFEVELNGRPVKQVTVQWSTSDGTATAGSDYQAASGTLTFNPGVRERYITIRVYGDSTPEPNETFFVNLFNPSPNAVISETPGRGTIRNDD
jgi:hypothetical protein